MMLKLYADFQNADTNGNVRLNTHGTKQDLDRLNIALRPGLKVTITDGELEADAVVMFSEHENVWIAKIDWEKIGETGPSPSNR